jgi:Ser/Thr protein kinase RdoA (MazF antagonist)
MQHLYTQAQPLDHARVARTLADLFDFGFIGEITHVHGSYASDNFRVQSTAGPLFLKRYRNRTSNVVDEIKRSEQYFAGEGIPVLLPLADIYGRGAFWHEGHWFSVFPWVDGTAPVQEGLMVETVNSLGTMLGRMHAAGAKFEAEDFQTLRLWDARRFAFEAIEIIRRLEQRSSRRSLDERMLEVLKKKQQYVLSNTIRPDGARTGSVCLLHGDFIPQNVFVDKGGEIEWVFDFEKTCVGPRAYELARSLFISCFDVGWDEAAFTRARAYLTAYRQYQSIDDAEVERGIRLYALNLAHMAWIEAKYVLFGIASHTSIYEQHAKRFEHLSTRVDEVVVEILKRD